MCSKSFFGKQPMLKISDFIKHAADCREMAKRTTNQMHKAQLEQMACTWEELAEERKKLLERQKRLQSK
jgi:hypothetical protein